MFPIPPLDGGRIAVGVPAQLGADLNIVSQVIASSTDSVIRTILRLTGNT
jgi:Zn-dependent protease